MIKDSINLEEVSDILAVSNTPAYLFSRLRALSSVQQAAIKFDPRDLIAEFQRIDGLEKPSAQEIALGYALLAAVSTSAAPIVRDFAQVPTSRNFEWGDEIKRRILSIQRNDAASVVDLSKKNIKIASVPEVSFSGTIVAG